MIVKCEQCQTRFKIPDEKVTEKGVKVRCTKCGNTFRVTRDSAAAASSGAGIATAQSAVFSPPSGLHAPAPAPAGAPDDPFSQFGSPTEPPDNEKTRRASFPLGQEASRVPDLGPPPMPPSHAPVPAPPKVPLDPRSSPQQGPSFDFGSLAPPGSAAPPPAVPAAQPAPFDFAALSGPPAAPAPPPGAAATAPFDFSALGPPPPGPLSGPPPAAAAPGPSGTPAFDFSAFSAGAAAQPAPATVPNLPPLDFSAPASPVAAPAPAPAGNADDFFAAAPPSSAPEPEGPAPGGTPLASVDLPDDPRALFDMPLPEVDAAPPPAAELPPGMPEPLVAPRPAAPAPAAGRAAEVAQGPSAEALKGYRRRPVVAIVVNVVIAVVLVLALVVVTNAYLNEGRLDARAFSPARLLALVSPPGDLVATDISNGLYDTRTGKSVFFVRGEVRNRGAKAMKARVRAELVEGGTMVRSAEVVAGAPPTPEQLYSLTSADELERLVAVQATRATTVAPEGSVPFVVTFFEYPPDLKAFRVRVTVVPEGEGETAAR